MLQQDTKTNVRSFNKRKQYKTNRCKKRQSEQRIMGHVVAYGGKQAMYEVEKDNEINYIYMLEM